MNWKNDEFKYEKYLTLDFITAFSRKFRDKPHDKISHKDVTDFIDEFFKPHTKAYKTLSPQFTDQEN